MTKIFLSIFFFILTLNLYSNEANYEKKFDFNFNLTQKIATPINNEIVNYDSSNNNASDKKYLNMGIGFFVPGSILFTIFAPLFALSIVGAVDFSQPVNTSSNSVGEAFGNALAAGIIAGFQELFIISAIFCGLLATTGIIFMVVGIVNWSIYAKKKNENVSMFFSGNSAGIAYNF